MEQCCIRKTFPFHQKVIEDCKIYHLESYKSRENFKKFINIYFGAEKHDRVIDQNRCAPSPQDHLKFNE